MAAVTGTIIALGGLGLSAAQALKANKDMKTASQAAAKAAGELKNIKEFNAFKQVQVPTLGFNLAQESKAQGMAQGINALQGMGAEGAGNVASLVQAGFGQDLALAAQAQEAQFKRDAMQAEAEQGIQSRKAERDFYAGINELQSAQMQRNAAEESRNAAIEGMFSSASTALTSGSKAVDLYKKSNATTKFNVGQTASQGEPGYGVLTNKVQQPTQNSWDWALNQSNQNNWNWALQQP